MLGDASRHHERRSPPLPSLPEPPALNRRTLIRSAAWSAPAVALAMAAPAAAASGGINVGDFKNRGTCGSLGTLGPGFLLTSGTEEALPLGTSVTIIGSGVANVGLFSVTGGLASVNVLSSTSRLISLTAALPGSATLAMRTTLSISVAFTLTAFVTLPTGYVKGNDAKPAGSVSSTLMLCSGY